MSTVNLKNHPALTASPDVDAIIQPLKEFFGVTSFCYQKNFHDGSEIRLSNQPAWIEHYLQHQLYKKSIFEHQPRYYHKDRFLWSSLTHHQPVLTAAKGFNIDHGIVFVEPRADGCEFFFIGTAPDNSRITGCYLRYMGILERFLGYFKEQAAPLLKTADQNRIVIPDKYQLNENPHRVPRLECEVFLKLINDNNIIVRFSPREKECLKLLLRGFTPKMIANELGLSARTIETHVNHIKQKTNSHTKTELIRYLIHNEPFIFKPHDLC